MRTILAVAALAIAAISAPVLAQQGTLTYTIDATPAPTAGQVIPKLTWATTPAATSCTASGATNWTGTKAASGTVTLPAVTPPVLYTLRCTWPGETSTRLTWTAPTAHTDGTPIANLAGYRVLYGASATSLTQTITVSNPSAVEYTVDNLTAGNWFFAMRAFTTAGAESAQSNTASKTISPPFEVTHSVGVKVPNSPTNLTAN